MIIKAKRLDCANFSSLKVTYINIEIHLFTESSPVFLIRRPASHHHQSLPLESECHLLQSPHNWIPEADVKQRNKHAMSPAVFNIIQVPPSRQVGPGRYLSQSVGLCLLVTLLY